MTREEILTAIAKKGNRKTYTEKYISDVIFIVDEWIVAVQEIPASERAYIRNRTKPDRFIAHIHKNKRGKYRSCMRVDEFRCGWGKYRRQGQILYVINPGRMACGYCKESVPDAVEFLFKDSVSVHKR